LKMQVEEVLANPLWPTRWPYSYEDFRPVDYTRDEPIPTQYQYQYSQSLIEADHHIGQYFFDGANVLELFSCYDSLLPPGVELGTTVGVGWYGDEMRANGALDDFIEQDVSVDPFLPLADNFFDFVIVPANFQLLQRPLEMFQEINRVLKPGGKAIIGV
ncbi:hypothetical protein B484DRAFT_304844, partial [Ochromonadaceae sp. CCMP2298]